MHAMSIDPEQRAQLAGYLNGTALDSGDERDAARFPFKQASLKDQERDELQRQVDAFLANGGTVQQCTAADNHSAKQPLKRTRKEQVKYTRRFIRAR